MVVTVFSTGFCVICGCANTGVHGRAPSVIEGIADSLLGVSAVAPRQRMEDTTLPASLRLPRDVAVVLVKQLGDRIFSMSGNGAIHVLLHFARPHWYACRHSPSIIGCGMLYCRLQSRRASRVKTRKTNM